MKPFSPTHSEPPADDWQGWLDSQGESLFLYTRQQTRCESDAKDVFQDALTESWRKAGGRIPDKALVLATIRRRAIDLGRSLDRRTRREQVVIESRPDWFAPDFSEGDTRDHLVAAVQALPEALREVLILKNWGDLTFPAIARMTGVSVATATSRYRYALERLRGTLTEVRP